MDGLLLQNWGIGNRKKIEEQTETRVANTITIFRAAIAVRQWCLQTCHREPVPLAPPKHQPRHDAEWTVQRPPVARTLPRLGRPMTDWLLLFFQRYARQGKTL